MRPEQVVVDAEAQRFCRENGIGLDEVRHARATGQPTWEGTDLDAGWMTVEGPRLHGPQTLRLLCTGDEFEIVSDVRMIG